MHDESLQWAVNRIGDASGLDVIEIGGMDINGNINHLFTQVKSYVCVDVADGPGVHVVAPFEQWAPMQEPNSCDLVACFEVLEHAENWRLMISSARYLLRPGGRFIGTCATINRAPHSAWGAPSPLEGEHYANIYPQDLSGLLLMFSDWTMRVTRDSMDVQWDAIK